MAGDMAGPLLSSTSVLLQNISRQRLDVVVLLVVVVEMVVKFWWFVLLEVVMMT